jgi:hypothetical protein
MVLPTTRDSSGNGKTNTNPHSDTKGFDDQPPDPAVDGARFVPPYYTLTPIHEDTPDVLDMCQAMGLDIKAYLVVETIAKLHRYDKKGYALKDLAKAIEQIMRLRDIVQAEEDAEALAESRGRNSSGTLAACVKGGDCTTPSQCLDAPGGCIR